jgi:DNA polymerase III subunit alpha
MSYVHLRVHTQYSFLQGMVRVKDLVRTSKEMGMESVAITDINNIFGAIDFYMAAKDKGIKPILGCEIFFTPEKGKMLTPLLLLCKDFQGYQNLSQILTQAYLDGAQNKHTNNDFARGVVDWALLDRFGEGLIVLSGNLRSEIPLAILQGREGDAIAAIKRFKDRFKEDFFLELVDSGLSEQDSVNQRLFELARQLSVPVVGTADVYYLSPDDADAHEVLQCIPYGRELSVDRPKSLVPREFFLKPPSVMKARLESFPGAYEATAEIASRCNLEFKFHDSEGRPISHLPDFRPTGVGPDEPFDLIAYFKKQSREGLSARFLEPGFANKGSKRALYDERLEQELSMIEKTGFAGYFLVVADFIRWAKENRVPVGPGRGSGAGSLVAYALTITDIDPIEFNLLFERFINPERVSMPDFDIDFCQDRRPLVIDYVVKKYGKDKVSQIITFGKLQAKAVLKDVGRVFGLSFADTNILTKLIPDELGINLSDAYEQSADLRAKMNEDAKLKAVWEVSLKLEGLYRNSGMHAAGVIITDQPIVMHCPLYLTKDGDPVTQFDKDFSEKIGLVKFDFLGLKTLTVIDQAVALIQKTSGNAGFDLRAISFSDTAAYDLISSGNTNGVFQVESDGMKDLCRRIIPNSLEDLTAICALYRPGPLGSGMVDDFIDRKHGRTDTKYELPELEGILKDTYGVILYQEQVMQIARDIAGYTLGQADMLRRAMGKKKPEEMAKQKVTFLAGAEAKGVSPQKADALFDLMAKFAEYGFNKSHSAAYGLITYQTAYLKAHFPAQFMAALMTTEMSDTAKLSKYVADARAMEIPILAPDVNQSQRSFTVESIVLESGRAIWGIRFGLEAIKGVGGAAVDVLLDARGDRPFQNLLEFFERVSTKKVNKKVLEGLTLAGAFDSVARVSRSSVFASLERLSEFGSAHQEEAELGQGGLFADFKDTEIKITAPKDQLIREEAEWPLAKRLLHEKAAMGFFLSGHPMDTWQSVCADWLGTNTQKFLDLAEGSAGKPPVKKEVQIVGLIAEAKEITTKKGHKMAFLQLEDLEGRIEVIAFPDFYAENLEILRGAQESAEPILLSGELEVKDGNAKILGSKVAKVADAYQGRSKVLRLELNLTSGTTPEQLRLFKAWMLKNRGRSPVQISFLGKDFRARMDLPTNMRVDGTPEAAGAVNRIFGQTVARLSTD